MAKRYGGQSASQGTGAAPAQQQLTHEDYIYKDAATLQWERVEVAVDKLKTAFDNDVPNTAIAGKVSAASELVHRLSECGHLDTHALDVFRDLCRDIMASPQAQGAAADVKEFREALDHLCKLAPQLRDIPMHASCCGEISTFESTQTSTGALLVVENIAGSMSTLAADIDKAIGTLESNTSTETCKYVRESFKVLETAASRLGYASKEAEQIISSCHSPQKVFEKLEAFKRSISKLASSHGVLLCELGQLRCLTSTVLLASLETKVEQFGYLSALATHESSKVFVREAALGRQFYATWTAMRTYVTGRLKEAFEIYEKRQVCANPLCYADVTSRLVKIIDEGISHASKFPIDPDFWDEHLLRHHRHLVDEVTGELQKISFGKNPEDIEPIACGFTRIGSYSMQLYSLLEQSRTDSVALLADRVTHFKEVVEWFNDPTTVPTSPGVLRQLETIAGALRWVENKARYATETVSYSASNGHLAAPSMTASDWSGVMLTFPPDTAGKKQYVRVLDAATLAEVGRYDADPHTQAVKYAAPAGTKRVFEVFVDNNLIERVTLTATV